MLQREELRIGNILIDPLVDNKVFIIRTGADIDHIYAMQHLKGYNISAKLLTKCGFSLWEEGEDMYFIPISSHNDEEHKVELHISIEGEVWPRSHASLYIKNLDVSETHFGWFHLKDDIRYLHQVQNLYYALAGIDLQIKL